MPVKRLPPKANLQHLRYQAKDLLKGHAARNLAVAQRIREFHPRLNRATDAEIFAARLSLSAAQLAIAREYGFESWARLKAHIEKPTLSDQLDLPHHQRIEDAIFRRGVALLDAGDVPGLREHLRRHPELAHQRVVFEGGNYFRNPTLLEFVAENPVRHGTLPPNIVEVTAAILDAGVDESARNETLRLVSTGRVPRECRVQSRLIHLLCDEGANPDTAVEAAALHGELEAVNSLLGRGARLNLPIAAALGRIEDFRQLLSAADDRDRHLALALAAQFGRIAVFRMLLDAGEDPNRYNPIGGHSHTTPLHQAAGSGYTEIVRLLVERGARLDIKDILWQATPADWAQYGGLKEIESYLRRQEKGKEKQE
jgi:ankyrin repeat protein